MEVIILYTILGILLILFFSYQINIPLFGDGKEFQDYPRCYKDSKNLFEFFDLGIIKMEKYLKPDAVMTKSEFSEIYNKVFKPETDKVSTYSNEGSAITVSEAFERVIDGLGYKIAEGQYLYGSKDEDYLRLIDALELNKWIDKYDDSPANREIIFKLLGNALNVTFKNYGKMGYSTLRDMHLDNRQFSFNSYEPEREITFINSKLEYIIRDKFDLDEEIQWKDLYYIKSIIVDDYDEKFIEDLSDLIWFVNLEEFVIKEKKNLHYFDEETQRIKIPNLSALKHLYRFEFDLGYCTFDLEQFSVMKSLKILNLGNNKAYGQIDAISQLHNLEYFKASGPIYGNFTTLSSLSNLKTISIPEGSSLIGNIKDLSELNNLEELYICNTDIGGDIESLKNLSNLRVLGLYDNNLDISGDLESLGSLVFLEEIYLSGTSINGELTSIKSLDKLTNLIINDTQISGMLEDINLSELVSLNLSNTQIKGNIKSLRDSHNLRYVSISNTRIGGMLSELENLKCLEALEVDNTLIHGSLELLDEEIIKAN